MESSWWDERSACPNSASKSSNNKSKLSLSAVAGIFYILILGMITAIACSLLEYEVVLLKCLIQGENRFSRYKTQVWGQKVRFHLKRFLGQKSLFYVNFGKFRGIFAKPLSIFISNTKKKSTKAVSVLAISTLQKLRRK